MASTDFSALTDEAILERAETAFREGVKAVESTERAKLFAQTHALYDELRKRGAENPDLFRNQGNAALLAGQLGEAIFAYRRGLRLAPNDRELRANLDYARDRVVYSSADNFAQPAVSLWPTWLPRLTPVQLLVLTFLFYSGAWAGITRWGMTRQKRPLQWAVAALAAAILLATAFVVQSKGVREDSDNPLVVIARDGTYLRKGNHSNYPRSYEIPLNQGVEARLLFVRGDWLQIQLAGGEVGWVPAAAVLVDRS
jgi:hypothetical protein